MAIPIPLAKTAGVKNFGERGKTFSLTVLYSNYLIELGILNKEVHFKNHISKGKAMLISHGGGLMAAQSISVQVSDRERCNAGCLFCISRITPNITADPVNFLLTRCNKDRLCVGFNYARYLGATHVIFTGKADPTQEEPEYLFDMIKTARRYLPLVDMHTNGYNLLPGKSQGNRLKLFVEAGLTMITLSIASFDQGVNAKLMIIKQSGADLIGSARDLGLLVRCSLVVNKQGAADFNGVMEYIKQAGERGAHQVVIREVWVPAVYGQYNQEVYRWNQDNFVDIGAIQQRFIDVAKNGNNNYGLRQLDPLPWGTPVFVMEGVFADKTHGVNVTFARCEESTKGSVIKSIVHKPNGHGYRNWEYSGDIMY